MQNRIVGLRDARDLIIIQEEGITRLQRFKKWAKENMVGLSTVAILIADIITIIIVSARKAILCGGEATGKFAKALYNLGKVRIVNSSFT